MALIARVRVAWLPQPGGRDITIIIDDDGYIELRCITSSGSSWSGFAGGTAG